MNDDQSNDVQDISKKEELSEWINDWLKDYKDDDDDGEEQDKLEFFRDPKAGLGAEEIIGALSSKEKTKLESRLDKMIKYTRDKRIINEDRQQDASKKCEEADIEKDSKEIQFSYSSRKRVLQKWQELEIYNKNPKVRKFLESENYKKSSDKGLVNDKKSNQQLSDEKSSDKQSSDKKSSDKKLSNKQSRNKRSSDKLLDEKLSDELLDKKSNEKILDKRSSEKTLDKRSNDKPLDKRSSEKISDKRSSDKQSRNKKSSDKKLKNQETSN